MFAFENDIKKIGLQFFADGGADDDKGEEDNQEEEKEDKKNNEPDEKKDDKSEENKVDRAALKIELLKELGFADEDTAKAQAKKYQEEEDKKLTDDQKKDKKINEEKAARLEAEREAAKSKAMVQAMKLGAKPDCVEDVIALVMAKTSGSVDNIDSAVGEIKKKHPSMFVDPTEDNDKNKQGRKGTGGAVRNNKKKDSDGEDSIGKRLAAMRSASKKKSSYFSK